MPDFWIRLALPEESILRACAGLTAFRPFDEKTFISGNCCRAIDAPPMILGIEVQPDCLEPGCFFVELVIGMQR
jgi:hypothetical protein